MTPDPMRASESTSGGEAQRYPRPTRRGVLLGVSLAGLGGALAGCSTPAAVPFDADARSKPDGAAQFAGRHAEVRRDVRFRRDSSSWAVCSPARPRPAAPEAIASSLAGQRKTLRSLAPYSAPASEIPVGGGKIYTAARVVVTQHAAASTRRSARCTRVGCIMSKVANGTIDCPCHGSEFKITTGAVVTGPAPAPLPKKQIKIVNGQVLLLLCPGDAPWTLRVREGSAPRTPLGPPGTS